jgi:hypothetical protein
VKKGADQTSLFVEYEWEGKRGAGEPEDLPIMM